MTDQVAALLVEQLSVDIAVAQGTLHAVREVDLRLERGRTLCLVGESGCGKSMTALALMGLLPRKAVRSARTLRVLGDNILDLSPEAIGRWRGDRVAMVFQDATSALNPAFNIGDQLVEGLLYHRPETSREQAWCRAKELLEICGVAQPEQRMGQYPHQLSGGLRQRVMIAMALMTEPALLIADEPTTALDATIQSQILDLLVDLQQRFNLALLFITHNLDVVRRIGDRVAILYAGRVVEEGPTDDILSRPGHPYTRALMACMPDMRQGTPARLGHLTGIVPSLIGVLQGCQFRNRCSAAHAACDQTPSMKRLNDQHHVMCWLDVKTLSSAPAAPSAPATERAKLPGPAEQVKQAPVLQWQMVQKIYPVRQGVFARRLQLQALRGVNLSLDHGEVLGVVGESGSGKSTLAKLALGLETPTHGVVMLRGQPVASYDRMARARLIQPVFQDPYASLNPRRSLTDTLRLALDIHQLGAPSERAQKVRRMMDVCGLPTRAEYSLPSQLSGGQRQRMALASALIVEPQTVVCDEPTSALDASVQAQILNLLQDLRHELSLSYVLISHDLHVIRYLATRVAVMYLGHIVEEQPTESLLTRPLHPYTRSLIASAGQIDSGPLTVFEGPNPMSPPQGCAFHPRCSLAQDICRREAPAVQAIGSARLACHVVQLPSEITLHPS